MFSKNAEVSLGALSSQMLPAQLCLWLFTNSSFCIPLFCFLGIGVSPLIIIFPQMVSIFFLPPRHLLFLGGDPTTKAIFLHPACCLIFPATSLTNLRFHVFIIPQFADITKKRVYRAEVHPVEFEEHRCDLGEASSALHRIHPN